MVECCRDGTELRKQMLARPGDPYRDGQCNFCHFLDSKEGSDIYIFSPPQGGMQVRICARHRKEIAEVRNG